MMNRGFTKTIFIIGLFLPLSFAMAEENLKADVAISFQDTGDFWSGQQVTLNLDLKTTGFSFSNSHFNLPEVNGAFLMQTDTTTIKFSKKINGKSWQVIRYPLALYPQKAGQLEIPSIGVRFTTSASFGSAEKAFEFQTKLLQLSVKSPPGVKQGELVITTASFELTHDWQPQSGTAQTGDAFTLTVTRRASDISSMLLPPLPVFQTEGLATYPQAPEVHDKTNRGDLSGVRIDSIIWVAEKPGSYDIPGIRFQWWDPINRELKQQIVPGLSLDILPPPMDKVTADAADKPGTKNSDYVWLLLAAFIFIAVFFLWLRFRRKQLTPTTATEKSTFTVLQKACRSNNITQTHAALHAWLVYAAPVGSANSRPMTLGEFARTSDDSQLALELEQLQEALIRSDNNWQGSALLNVLGDTRNKIIRQKTVQLKVHLSPLNP